MLEDAAVTLGEAAGGEGQAAQAIAFVRVGPAGDIEVFLNGASLGTFRPTGRLIAFGQGGDDAILAASEATRLQYDEATGSIQKASLAPQERPVAVTCAN